MKDLTLSSIKKCRVCKSKDLLSINNIKQLQFVVCKKCTLLQRKDDIPFEIKFNFEGRSFILDYYPVFLSKGKLDCVTDDTCVFFSFTAIEYLLNSQGYKIISAQIIGTKLGVSFDRLLPMEKIRLNEERMKLDNFYTYFLWNMQGRT